MVSIVKERTVTPVVSEQRQSSIYTLDQWKSKVDILAEFQRRKGPFVELGGPTPGGYKLISLDILKERLGKRPLVTNIVKNPSVEMLTNGQGLPFPKDSLGAVFISSLPIDVRDKIAEEVYQSLESGGLFVYQGALDQNVDHALNLGFKILEYGRKKPNVYNSNENAWNLVLQKPE